jgi:hypothetical protein
MTTSSSLGHGTSPSLSNLHLKTSFRGMNPFFSRPWRRLSQIELAGNDAIHTGSKSERHKEEEQHGRFQEAEHKGMVSVN